MSGTSGYQAAKRELASLRRFSVRPRTADEDALPSLPELRARSRDMLMNAPLAAGAVNTVVTNVVGTGLMLTGQADRATLAALAGVTEEEAQAAEQGFEREMKLFGRAQYADTNRRHGLRMQQELAFRGVLASGDIFAAVVAPTRDSPFDFSLQLLEADRVCNPNNRPVSDTLADGIEYDAGGAPAACHVAELSRTGMGPRNWRRLPLYAPDGSPRVLHLMHAQRVGQSRGVPYLAPVVAALKDLDRYTQAELTAAVINACIAITGTSTDGSDPLKKAASDPNQPAGLRQADIAFEPGMVLEGFLPGEAVSSFSTERPSTGFDPFVQAVLRQVGTALEIPFELLVKHFTAFYSAAQAALLQANAFFKTKRTWLTDVFLQPVYEMVAMNAVLRGRVKAKGFLEDPMIRAAWLGSRWTGPSFGHINPQVVVNAAEKRLQLRLSSRARETAELTGDDWEAVATEIASEDALLKSLGLPATEAAPTTAPPPVVPPGPTDEGTDTETPGEAPKKAMEDA